MKIGFIGVGKMATAIIQGLKKADVELVVSGRSLDRSKALAENLGLAYADSHQDLIDQVDLVILGIKPQVYPEVLSGLTFTKPVISMAAGLNLDRLAQLLESDLPIIRIMPNINAQILQSSTALVANQQTSPEIKNLAIQICQTFGTCYEISEKDFDTFTALAGSSPAYIALFTEALAKSGVKHGLPKDLALEIVSQTMLATSQNLLTGQDSPTQLIDKIASPGGTTIAGLLDLEKTGLTASVVSAIDATIARAEELNR